MILLSITRTNNAYKVEIYEGDKLMTLRYRSYGSRANCLKRGIKELNKIMKGLSRK